MSWFGRLVKWVISMTLLVIGTYFLNMAGENNDVRPVILCVFTYGAVYLMYRTRAEIPRPIGFLTAAITVGSIFAAKFLWIDLPVLNGGMFLSCWGWMMIVGIPVMALGFRRYG